MPVLIIVGLEIHRLKSDQPSSDEVKGPPSLWFLSRPERQSCSLRPWNELLIVVGSAFTV